jgi:NAD(P)-dependent dehydrogenase (short-subunit alcohol dehydrogenase family)
VTPLQSLEGKLVFVTGGGQGLRAAICRTLGAADKHGGLYALINGNNAGTEDPANVAATIKHVLLQPEGTAISEVMVLPIRETSWP